MAGIVLSTLHELFHLILREQCEVTTLIVIIIPPNKKPEAVK